MSTHDTITCPDCGATYPAGGFGGMCPHCLLSDTFPEASDPETELVGSRIDDFTLLEKIGEGGMGSVWKARQEAPIQRDVAVKLIKLGMDTQVLVARFESERQVLATLDHPGIARIFDAGTAEDGRPYYAMELVDGLPITDYCAKHSLPLKDRLGLFRQVCTAVQHAHEKGIIHRDLKPTNVLVSDHENARLKLIDFGVAKSASPAMVGDTLFTQAGQMLGTPGYMSPEQADGAAQVDTRADVYSLGAMLYELVSDAPPFSEETLREAGLLEVIRIIKEVEPPKPSTHSGKRPSALDWIALKALAKQPEHRYQSPSELAADIDRFLEGKAVTASAPGVLAKAGKLLRRHPIAAAALAIALPLAGATFLITQKARPPTAVIEAEKTTVTTTADSDPGSLRALIAAAPERSEIHFDPALEGKTIQLAGEPLLIDKHLTIDATEHAAITIDAGGQSGVFVIEGEKATVELAGLTISGGVAEQGGAIENHAILSLRRCILKNNRAKTGGALSNHGAVTADDCLFTDNRADENGGAMFQSDANVYASWYSAQLRRCTFARNEAQFGGAIFYATALLVWNSTFTENRGTAIYARRSTSLEIQLSCCTITGNSGEQSGGVDAGAEKFFICRNTLIAGNTPQDLPTDGLQPTGTGSLFGSDVDPQLAPLGDYGGFVPTMPPLPGSPLIDAGSTEYPEELDARGLARPIGDAYDVGAVEFDPARDDTP